MNPALPAPCKSALLIHGAGGGSWEWNLWRGVMQGHQWFVHAMDLVPAAEGLCATRLEDYRQQVQSALQGLPHPRVVVGASVGGLLALQVADHADALVLVNPFPPAPWHRQLSSREWEDTVAWHGNARLASSRQAMPDCDEASTLFAFRHWKDESGFVLRQAYAGIEVRRPACPALFVLSAQDEDLPSPVMHAMAEAWQAEKLETFASSHVGPLLGRSASRTAAQAVAWLNTLPMDV